MLLISCHRKDVELQKTCPVECHYIISTSIHLLCNVCKRKDHYIFCWDLNNLFDLIMFTTHMSIAVLRTSIANFKEEHAAPLRKKTKKKEEESDIMVAKDKL